MKNKILKTLIKEKLSELIPYGLIPGNCNLTYPLNDTGYMITYNLTLEPEIYFLSFQNSIINGVLYDSEFNAFFNTYID